MAVRGKCSVLLVSVLAASFLSAPMAQARPTCQETEGLTRCETNGSVSIKAVPTTRASQSPGWAPGRSGIILSW